MNGRKNRINRLIDGKINAWMNGEIPVNLASFMEVVKSLEDV